jgi:flavin-dependent dehydrogenase
VLAQKYAVALIDQNDVPQPRIGESLVPAARRVLRDMNLLEIINERGYAPYLGNRSAWGQDSFTVTDFLQDPDGPGWHLDRVDFETTLRRTAAERGAQVIAPVKMRDAKRHGQTWTVTLNEAGSINARILVDATGRKSAVARRLGNRSTSRHKTVSVWAHLKDNLVQPPDSGFSSVISTEAGWWYTASLGARRVLSLHTDSDLVRSEQRFGRGLLEQAMKNPLLEPVLHGCVATAGEMCSVAAANSLILPRASGYAWLAAGDAAGALDPLSSRGIFHSLYKAFAGAMEIDEALVSGDLNKFDTYAAHITEMGRTNHEQEHLFYQIETRWPDAPFWMRRRAEEQFVAPQSA